MIRTCSHRDSKNGVAVPGLDAIASCGELALTSFDTYPTTCAYSDTSHIPRISRTAACHGLPYRSYGRLSAQTPVAHIKQISVATYSPMRFLKQHKQNQAFYQRS